MSVSAGEVVELRIGDWRVTVPPGRSELAAGPAPTLSVIITYYRGRGVVAEAVRSVLEQTVPADEIVICDDGSPDDLDAGLGALREHVTVVRKPNGGTGSALNAAARAARGDYVVQLDVDDAFHPRRLEAFAAVLAVRPDVDILCSDALIEHRGRTVARMAELNPPPARRTTAVMLERNWIPWPAARRSAVLDGGGWDERFEVVEDWDRWLRLVLGGAVVAYVHEPLYRWRLTPGSRSSSSRVAYVEDLVRLVEKALAGSSLAPGERRLAASLLHSRRRLLAREQARHAIETAAGDARGRSSKLVFGAGFDGATRAKAAVATLSPGLARRLLARRRASSDPAALELAQRGFGPSG